MSILRDVAAELRSMFLGDLRLTSAILALVGLAATLLALRLPPLAAGAVLLAGCLALLPLAALQAARRERAGADR